MTPSRPLPEQTGVAVVGGSTAGLALAVLPGRTGVPVTVLERQPQPAPARRGEILQLKWSDVHKDKIIVRGKTTKSSQTREIPLNKETTKVFKDWHSDSDWVFPGSGENPLTTVKRSWGNVKKAAKLPDLRFHDLRHTFATRILRRGADIKTVSALLGHANIATTTKYLHATDESKKKAVEML